MPDLVRSTALRGQSQSGRDQLARNLAYFSIALRRAGGRNRRCHPDQPRSRTMDMAAEKALGRRPVSVGSSIHRRSDGDRDFGLAGPPAVFRGAKLFGKWNFSALAQLGRAAVPRQQESGVNGRKKANESQED